MVRERAEGSGGGLRVLGEGWGRMWRVEGVVDIH